MSDLTFDIIVLAYFAIGAVNYLVVWHITPPEVRAFLLDTYASLFGFFAVVALLWPLHWLGAVVQVVSVLISRYRNR